MEKILYLAHTDDAGALPKSAREALTAALSLLQDLEGATLTVGLIGKDASAAAATLGGAGLERFLAVEGADFEVSRYATDAAAAAALATTAAATLVVAPGTPRFARCLPGVARRLSGAIDTRITGLKVDGGAVRAERWYYRQRIVTEAGRSARPWLLLTSPGAFTAWDGDAGNPQVEQVAVELSATARRTRVEGVVTASSGQASTIRPEAELLFVAGAGWTKQQPDGQNHAGDAESLVLGFLEQTGASLGSSKSLVDQGAEGESVMGFMSHLNQVGQTGSTPRHGKGLSTCCHGEEPHVVGWRFIRERRAINLNAGCGWAQGKADVLYVADAFEVMKEVNALLAQS